MCIKNEKLCITNDELCSRFGRGFYKRLREHDFELTDLSETADVSEARELVVPTYEYSGRGPVSVIRMVRCEPGAVTVDGGESGTGAGAGTNAGKRKSQGSSAAAARL